MAAVTATGAFFTWNEWDFWARPNGHLFCEECATEVWCVHIQKMVEANGDAEELFAQWAPGTMDAIEVPMFPTKNLWERMYLKGHEKITAYRVSVGEENAEKTF